MTPEQAEMIKKLDEFCADENNEDLENYPNEWSRSFLKSIYRGIEGNWELSEKQRNKLKEIYEQVFGGEDENNSSMPSPEEYMKEGNEQTEDDIPF